MSRSKVFFRADGHAKMGLGHVIRSLALADMLKENFECHFMIRNPLPTLKVQILEVCQSLIDLEGCPEYNKEAQHIVENHLTGDEIVVLDGYHFGTKYQKIIKDKGCKLVCIDDIHAYHFVADAIINHAGGVSEEVYSAESYTSFHLGLQHSLLRKPFLDAAIIKNYEEQEHCNVFICLGGADPNNDTLEVLKICERNESVETVYLVIGSAYQYRKLLEDFLKNSTLEVKLLSNLNAEEMVCYMKKCGRAITPPSTISYEYLSVGGELYLKTIADNQIDINDFFIREKLAFDIEKFLINEKKVLPVVLQKQSRLLDGHSGLRFLELFNSLNKRCYRPVC